jgi:hypothetical protein
VDLPVLVRCQPDGTVKTPRKYQSVGLSKSDGAITKRHAEIERDKFLSLSSLWWSRREMSFQPPYRFLLSRTYP